MEIVIQYIIAGLIIIAGLAAVIFHLKMIYDAFKNGQAGWGILIIFLSFLGSLLYYFMIYKNRSQFDRKY